MFYTMTVIVNNIVTTQQIYSKTKGSAIHDFTNNVVDVERRRIQKSTLMMYHGKLYELDDSLVEREFLDWLDDPEVSEDLDDMAYQYYKDSRPVFGHDTRQTFHISLIRACDIIKARVKDYLVQIREEYRLNSLNGFDENRDMIYRMISEAITILSIGESVESDDDEWSDVQCGSSQAVDISTVATMTRFNSEVDIGDKSVTPHFVTSQCGCSDDDK